MKFSISSLVSVLQLRCRTWYGSLGLIPGPMGKCRHNIHQWVLHRYTNFTAHELVVEVLTSKHDTLGMVAPQMIHCLSNQNIFQNIENRPIYTLLQILTGITVLRLVVDYNVLICTDYVHYSTCINQHGLLYFATVTSFYTNINSITKP